MKGTTHSCLFLAIAMGMFTASAQAATTKHVETDSLRSASMASIADLADHLGLEGGSGLTALNSAATAHGTRTVRMQQTWRGLPIFGATLTVEVGDHDAVTQQRGDVFVDLAADLSDIRPELSAAQAREIWRKQSQTLMNAPLEARDANLMVYPQEHGKARLVYQLSYFVGGEHPSRPSAIMDANTGEIIEQWEGLTHADAQGPGGNKKTGLYTYGADGRPALKVKQEGAYCSTDTNNVRTYHLRNSTNIKGGQIWRFLCPSSQGDAVNDAYGPINDAHHFGGVVFDMYRSYMDAAPLKNALLLKVHYGSRYENAFWNGSEMGFGDGARTFYPLVALDVVSHEVSHGFTEQNSGLIYAGQSGGMNEAFSDMAGEAAKWFDQNSNDFLVGASIFKASGQALRYMCEPTKDGRSIDHASKYRSGIDVHYSSGIYNKAYCLLTKSKGWDPEKSFKAFARANMLYWKANETFNGGACGVERAAADLGFASADVTAAFDAVGVACKR